MKDPERWKELAALAATEQDPNKFMALIHEIDRLLAEKKERLDSLQRQKPTE